ncbi:hypothetical protein WA556_004410, partial [Blastocystis sp. ATCC 50177/Nand II]
MTDYILSFNDANDIKASLKDIIGNESVANRIATEILKSRGQLVVKEERTTALKPKQSEENVTPKESTQPKSSNQEPVKEDNPNSVPSTPVKDKKKVDERVEFTHPIKSSVIPKAKCHCLGTKHPVLFNCTECGNIICKEEELEVCTYCGTFSQHYRRKYRNAKEEEALMKAIENKNRLLQYDRDNTARSQVYDDQSDYFDLNDRWSGKKMDPNAYKPVYEQRSKQPIAISFDFAGRRVVVDEKRVESSTKRKEAPKEEEAPVQREGGYYLAPTEDGKPMQKPKQESASLDVSEHAYENNTLQGKASIVYESLTKKLEHGLKLSEVRVKDGKKNKHVSKNWMKDE